MPTDALDHDLDQDAPAEAPDRDAPGEPAGRSDAVEAPATVLVERATPVTAAEPSAFARVLAGLGEPSSPAFARARRGRGG